MITISVTKKSLAVVLIAVISLFLLTHLSVQANDSTTTVKQRLVVVAQDDSDAFVFEIEGTITEVITEGCQILRFETDDNYFYYSPTDIMVMMEKNN